MTRAELLAFLRRHRLCKQSSVSGVSDDLEIVFDTLAATRKTQNLRRDPRIGVAAASR